MPRRPSVPIISALVLAGLAACVALVLFVMDDPGDPLPGVALGSELILAVERALALFGAWMLVVVIVARAIGGELPSEISGRGVRYADADRTHTTVRDSHHAISTLRVEVDKLRDVVYAQADTGDRGL